MVIMSTTETPKTEDQRARQRNNLLVLLAVVLILGVGGWLVDRMLAARALQNCIEARHKNCVRLELPPR